MNFLLRVRGSIECHDARISQVTACRSSAARSRRHPSRCVRLIITAAATMSGMGSQAWDVSAFVSL